MYAELGNMNTLAKRKLVVKQTATPRQKSNKKAYENLMLFGPNLAYVHVERT